MQLLSFFLALLIVPLYPLDLSFTLKGITQLGTVGALFECSQKAVLELCRQIHKDSDEKLRILELGAGKGTVTAELVKRLLPDDILDVIEIDQEFCAHLQKTFPVAKYPQVTIHHMDMLKFSPSEPYDIIICTLPFNAFDADLVISMLTKIESFATLGTHMSYIEYLAGATLRKITALATAKSSEEARRSGALKKFKKDRLQESVRVFLNPPPTYIHHLKF